MGTVIVLLVVVALAHSVLSFYGRLIRLGFGLAMKRLDARRDRRGSDFDDPSF